MAHNHTFPAVFLGHYSYFHSIPPWWFPIVFPQHSHAVTSTMGFPQHSQIIHRVFLEYSYTVPELLLQNSQDNCASTIPTVFPRCSHSVPSLIHYHPIVFRCYSQYSHSITMAFSQYSQSVSHHNFPIAIPVLFPQYSHSIRRTLLQYFPKYSHSTPRAFPLHSDDIITIFPWHSHAAPAAFPENSYSVTKLFPQYSTMK